MTQTVSSKSRLRQCLTTFKWELRNCSGALLVFAILAGVFTTVIFTICLVVGFSEATDSWSTANAASIDYDAVRTAVKVFQIIASTQYGSTHICTTSARLICTARFR